MTTLIAKATLMMLSYKVRNFDSAGAEYVQVPVYIRERKTADAHKERTCPKGSGVQRLLSYPYKSPGQLKTIKGKNKALWLNEGQIYVTMVELADTRDFDNLSTWVGNSHVNRVKFGETPTGQYRAKFWNTY